MYILKLLLSLPTKSTDHVSGESNIRDDLSDFIDEIQIGFSGVVASHSKKHVSVAALGRQMHTITDVVVRGYGVQQLFREVFRMWGRESKPNIWESLR